MSSEYALDGVDMDQPGRWRVMLGTLLPSIPTPRLSSTEVPYRNGVIDGVGQKFGTFTVTINFMVEGATRAALEQNWTALQARLRNVSGLSTLRYTPEGFGAREARVRLQSVAQPTYTHRDWIIETTAVFEAVEGVWKDVNYTVQPFTDLKDLSGGSAPITDAQVMLMPTSGAMTIRDVVSGTWLAWKGVLTGEYRVLIDVASYSAVQQAFNGWELAPSHKEASAEISMSPGGFQLTPGPDGKIVLATSGGTGYVRARKAY